MRAQFAIQGKVIQVKTVKIISPLFVENQDQTELLKKAPLGDKILAQDQARLKRAKRIGPGCSKN